MGDVTLQFRGFTPTTVQRDAFKEMIDSISHEAPRTAVIRVSISNESDGFSGVVHVISPIADVLAVATATRVDVLGLRLRGRIRRQLERSKARRRNHRALKDLTMKNNFAS